jgi:hypothetical protein
MGRNYATIGDQTATNTDSVLGIDCVGTTVRPKIYYLCFGSGGTPEDQASNMQMRRFTASGTGTAVTPQAIDPADPANTLVTGKSNHTVEPTYTAGATLLSFSVNEQATFQWYAPPGSELVIPATADSGIGLQFVITSATTVHQATFFHAE